ncbi:hypothetical protein [Mesorhizobium sp. CN2-181]|uniref:hypothetical protein n=1 Tax=Mesorhizobium yinganensis TaxID=3157707 RepID=UPI0032B7FE0A
MRSLFLASALIAAVALPAAAQSVAGKYSVAGTNFDGSTYTGEAEITQLSQTTCAIRWNTGGSVSKGVCMRNEDAFAAFYALGKTFGLVVYKVMPDGSLHGVWTITGQNGSGTEVLTPK